MELLFFSIILVPFTIAFIILALQLHPAFGVGAVAGFLLWLFIISFFRNPPREIPVAPNILVSPADGVITHLEEVEEVGIGKAFRISIFLSVFNVHVNRVPLAGTITHVRYYPGAFLDARSNDCAKRNEQLWIDMVEKDKGFPVRVKQIAGAIARRIVCQVGVGKFLRRGELYGMIKFGSRTDVLVPADLVEEVLVKVGSAVSGGSTIILKLKP
jgi:phosphatidylserine decarboxylase